MGKETNIGIDAGGTLIKVAYQIGEGIQTIKFPTVEMERLIQWITETIPSPKICVTGGKGKTFAKRWKHPVDSLAEFTATCVGVQYLVEQWKYPVDQRFILTNVGTGTSIHYIEGDQYSRIGGIGVGGGTLLGLSYLLTGIDRYDDIAQLARTGNRDVIDIKVKDIYADETPPISGDLTASNFGKAIDERQRNNIGVADLTASIIGMIGETVTTISCQAANRFSTSSIVYIGSTFHSNPLLIQVMKDYTILRGEKPFFIDGGEYSGAIGALLVRPE